MTSGSSPVLDVIIPVYNEGQNIRDVLAAFQQETRTPIRVLLCYDRDDDTTLEAAKAAAVTFPVVPVKNAGRYAHGAVVTGFRASTAPAAITYMADDDYNAGLIDSMVALFHEGNHVVCASRFMPGGSMINCPWPKSWLVEAVAWSLNHLGGLPVHDPTNAFRLFSRDLLQRVPIQSSQGFTYSMELLAKCHRLGWKMAEIPAQWRERRSGASRFRVFRWAPAYLRWYFYILVTTCRHRATLRA